MISGWRVERAVALVLGLAVVLSLALAGPALAAPAWQISSLADSTVAPRGTLDYIIDTRNAGDVATDGTQISVVADLPPGMTAASATLFDYPGDAEAAHPCFNASDGKSPVAGASSVICPNTDAVPVTVGTGGHAIQKMLLTVSVDPSAAGVLTAKFIVSGGGAASAASTVDATPVSAASPGFGIAAFDGSYGDGAGDPLSQAGGHPADASVSLDFNTVTNPAPVLGLAWPVEPVKDVLTDLPAGFAGNPTAADTCTVPQLANSPGGAFSPQPLCPATSQVGTTTVRLKGPGLGLGGANLKGPLPVYNMVPPPGVPAAFGFNLLGSVIVLDASVRTGGDYGISVDARNVPEPLAIIGTTVDFWGVPSDPSHDSERGCPGQIEPDDGGPVATDPRCVDSTGQPLYNRPPPAAFLRMPTSCTAPGVGIPTTAHVDSWTHPGAFQSATWYSHQPPGYPYAAQDFGPQVGVTGCDQVPFTPSFTGAPDSSQAGQPSAFSFDLGLPQSNDPSSIAESDLKTAVVSLPAGVRVNPSSADGLAGCGSAQIALSDPGAPSCPDASKIGTVTVTTPLLSTPMTGSVYLAAQGDNPFGSLIALYIVAQGSGVVLKLPGRVDMDPATGQITTTFDNNPQLPFSDLSLQLKGGPRAPLVLPDACGSYTVHSSLSPWARPDSPVATDNQFSVTMGGQSSGCPAPGFSPAMSAGSASAAAGASSPFTFRLTRQDGDQNVAGISVTLPPGLVAKLAGVPLCPDQGAASGDCPAASQVGSTTVGTGFGPDPLYIPQPGRSPTAVFLAGAYKGAPYSLVIRVPAQAGPFDLGTVVVRAAINLDPTTAQVTVTSDPLPQIIQGIPLPYRDVRVTVDRPGFMRSATSCNPTQVSADVTSAGRTPQIALGAQSIGYAATAGPVAHLTGRYQLGGCAKLGFSPKLKIALTGKGRTRSNDHPNLIATLTQPGGQANIQSARVALPLSLALDPNNSQHVCNYDVATAVHGGAVACPSSTIVGRATAVTPLLDRPLTGNVYLVQGIRFGRGGARIHTLPTLLVPLRGQIALDLRASSAVNGAQQLVTTFSTIPDAAVSKFTLQINGGRKGILVITGRGRTICGASQVANADFGAQSGKANTQNDTLTTPCPKVRHTRAKHRTRRGARRARR